MKSIILVIFFVQYSLNSFAENLTTKVEAKIRTATEQACNDNYCYFVKQGRVYKGKRGENMAYGLHFSTNVKAVITYKGQLYAVQNNGTLYTWGEDKMCWIQLGRNIDKLQTDDKLLYSRA